MFSGIVEGTGKITAIKKIPAGRRFIIQLGRFTRDLKAGASVSINGVCLTVEQIKRGQVQFLAIPETLRKTNLGQLTVGSFVNIERSLKLGDTISGHFVAGHVDGVGKITRRLADKKEYKLWIKVPVPLRPYIAPRGSVALNGVSLTVAEVKKDIFAVALIPLTLELTNLGQLELEDGVNIEIDLIARQIVHLLTINRAFDFGGVGGLH